MGTFNPSDTFRVLLVDPNENPYSLSGIFAMGSFNPSDTARVVLVDPDGNPYKATGGSGGGATIQVNGVDTSDQTLLNFVDTASVTWANPSGGIVEATATGGGGSGTVTQVNTTAPITGGPITTTGTIGITQASASVNGFLSSTDWNTFNNKQPAGAYLTAVTANAPLSGSGTSGSHLVISQSGAATDGYLSSTDWNTFNNKVGGPAGLDTQIQFNDGGSFGGDAQLTYDKTTGTPTARRLHLRTSATDPFVNIFPDTSGNIEIDADDGSYFTLGGGPAGIGSALTVIGDTILNTKLTMPGSSSDYSAFFSPTITTFTGLSADYATNFSYTQITATDGVPGDPVAGVKSRMVVGPSAEAVEGNFHAVVADIRVRGNGNDNSEYTSWLGLIDSNIGTGYTQSTGPAGRIWGSDWTVQGPIAVQPNLLNGFTQFVGNYYNGSPTASSSGGIWISTSPNGGAAGTEGARNGATTYPVDVGLGITGASGTVGTPSGLGFTTGIQIGGNGSGWWESGQTRIGTGINIRDFITRGIYVNNPIGTPTADIETTGKVIVGGNLTNSVLTASELVGTDASKNLASVAVGTGLSLSGGTLSATGGATTVFQNPGLRLTLTTGVPVTTSDVTAAGTLYWTPMFSGNVWYWDGSAWQVETITEQSLSLTLTSGKNYDVFYLHGTGLVLSSAWTNDTTRADALGTQNGVTVLSSDHTKLWIGTIRASGTNVTEDSGGGTTTQVGGKRFVFNAYNQVPRSLAVVDKTDSWTNQTAGFRQSNGASGNQVEYVSGVAFTYITARAISWMTNSTGAVFFSSGVGIDSTSTNSAQVLGSSTPAANTGAATTAFYNGTPGLGYHAVVWLENPGGGTAGTSTWAGDGGRIYQQDGLVADIVM